VSGGFSANLLLGPIDPLLAGITQAAAASSGVKPGYVVHATANYYFLVAATFLLTAVGWFVTEKIVEPRLGR
jgi:aminobenzoyl-glutamate transport protein